MTASTRDPASTGDDAAAASPEIAWLSGPALRLHAALAAGLALSGGATWLEWTRAHEGHAVAWVYTLEWPLFALLGVLLWWRLLHADARAARQSARPPRTGTARTGDAAEDPELLAWQAYLTRLHAVDPPGGPPGR